MSEGGVGLVVREALDAARAQEIAARQGYYRRLERVAELGRVRAAQETGDLSIERLLEDMWHIDRAEAGRLVDESGDHTPGVSLLGLPLAPRLPTTATVLAAGEIGAGHVGVIRRAMSRLDKLGVDHGVWCWAEGFLAGKATVFAPRKLDQLAAELIRRHDPDGAAPDESESRFDALRLVSRRDGSLEIHAKIHDTADADMLREGFDVMSGRAGPDDDRSLDNRQACALKEVFADAHGPHGVITDTRDGQNGDEPDAEPGTAAEAEAEDGLIPDPRRAEPAATPDPRDTRGPGRALLTITMDERWLRLATGHGTLDSGALVSPATVRRWACDAEIVPMVLGAKSEPLDIGRRSRLVPDAMRRALNFRDGGCAFPGCTRRPRRCQAHHVNHWVDLGPTCLDNLTLLCRHHHQVIHHGHWTVAMIDGLPWFTPPWWIDPDRRPRPGGRSATLSA